VGFCGIDGRRGHNGVMMLSGTNLACARAGLPIFRNVNFTVGAGEALLVTGPNGAGKTTLLRLIAGLIRPTQGYVTLAGADPEASVGEEAHYLAHQDAIKPSLTVAENLGFWSRFLGRTAPLEAALAAVRLDGLAGLPAAYLSAGQRRRLSLARLLAVQRPIWLLDEPTAALDAAGQASLAQIMQHHLASGGVIIAATHGPLGLDGARELKLGGAHEEQVGAPIPGPSGHDAFAGLPGKGSGERTSADGLEASTGGLAARAGRGEGGAALIQSLAAILARDMKIALRVGGGALMGVLFFLAVVTIIPFALGPDLALLRHVGPAVLWLGALLASLLALDRLLAVDQDDGSLDLIVISHAPLELVVGAKAAAHWFTTGLPLVVASPLFGVLLNLEPASIGAVALTLLVGTPALTFIGLIGAALAVALRRGGILLPVLVLPLAIPVLVFGVSAANAALGGPVPFGTPFTILCALTLISLVIGPFAAAATLRHTE
jgi:heme exporter protein B